MRIWTVNDHTSHLMNMKSITTCIYITEKLWIVTTYSNSFEMKMSLVIFQIQLFEVELLNSNLFTFITKDHYLSEVHDNFLPCANGILASKIVAQLLPSIDFAIS